MPVPSSHNEFSVIFNPSSFMLIGGQIYKDPETFLLKLTNVIQKYDVKTNQWSIAGHLPYAIKTSLAAHHEGWIYVTTGQRDRGAEDPSPGRIERRVWRTKSK
ncbi:MAG: hypothetical protein LW832_04160 [Parachlamydia sp.]|jgi:hypothetical protein|nr:hypothetical protein [Parachlamydia sp.]